MRKLKAVFSILFKDNLNYRAQAVVWILTAVVPTLTTAYVWIAASGGRDLGQFSQPQLLVYFLGAIMLANITTSAIGFDMGQEIKDGKLSFYLVRPLDYFSYQFIANVAWRLFRSLIFVPFFLILVIIYWHQLAQVHLHFDIGFWLLVIIGHLISFFIGFAIGGMALHFEEVRAAAMLFILSNLLFSGQLAPVSLMPPFLQSLAGVLPFRYVMSVPLEHMVGHQSNTQSLVLLGCAWVVTLFLIGQVIYRFGLKRYSAIGQ